MQNLRELDFVFSCYCSLLGTASDSYISTKPSVNRTGQLLASIDRIYGSLIKPPMTRKSCHLHQPDSSSNVVNGFIVYYLLACELHIANYRSTLQEDA
jgi:hypothetical protein